MLGILRIPEILLETRVRPDVSARKCSAPLPPFPPFTPLFPLPSTLSRVSCRNSRKFSAVTHFRTWIFDETVKPYNSHNSALITALTSAGSPLCARAALEMARGVERVLAGWQSASLARKRETPTGHFSIRD